MLDTSKLFFGGDYNPEQWDESVWDEDIQLMRRLGVNLVSLGIFSWASIEKEDGKFDFSWMDKIVQKLSAAKISIDMATGTASPPAWLARKHPEMLATTDSGVSFNHGGRQHYSPASAAYKQYSHRYLEKILDRYAGHSSIVMWHVNNEIGCHNPYDFGEETNEEFRKWLKNRYGKIEDLNRAWYTTFWSQRYGSFEEIESPSFTSYGTKANPTMQLDFRRYSSDQLLSIFIDERDLIRKYDQVTPITTNFMSMRHITAMDYWKWAKEVDFISTDHYLNFDSSDRKVDLAFFADLTRGFAGGENWLIMEHSTSAVNWQPVNTVKSTEEIIGNSLNHVFRGSQGALYFQFRQSKGGSERFHSAIVPHSGIETRIGRAMEELSAKLQSLSSISSNRTETARIAMIFDYEDSWVTDQENLPSQRLNYLEELFAWYKALHKLGINVDFIDKNESFSNFSDYEVILAPMMHIVENDLVARLDNYVKSGGVLFSSYFSGASDSNLALNGKSFGGDLLGKIFGVLVEEYAPMLEEAGDLSNGYRCSIWREFATLEAGVETIATFISQDESHGQPAITRHNLNLGKAIYVGTSLDSDSLVKMFGSELAFDTSKSGLSFIRRGQKYLVSNSSEEVHQHAGKDLVPGESIIYDSAI